MATKNILKKIVKNGVEYYLPEDGGGGGDLDIGQVNALIDMKLGNYDSLFSVTSGLYKILNSIDSDDEIGLTAGDSRADIVANSTSMSKISHCYAVMCYTANSSVAMNGILGSSSATKEISECWNSISVVADCELSAILYLGSSNGQSNLGTRQTVQDAFFGKIGKYSMSVSDSGFIGLLGVEFSLLEIVADEKCCARINSISADDLLPAIYEYTGDLGYESWTELAADDSAISIIQSNSNAMKIISAKDDMYDYFYYTMNSNTLSYFPFETDFNDKKGNRNLNSRNGVSISDGVLNVTSKTSYLVPSSTIGGSIITVGVWYYYTADSTDGGWNTLFAKLGGTYHHLLFPAKASSGTIGQVGFYNSSWYPGNITMQKDKWYFLVMVKNGTNEKIYVNGELAINSNSSFNNNSQPIGIFCNYNTNQQQGFQGKLSDMFFESSEWNQTKIQEKYNKRKWKYK